MSTQQNFGRVSPLDLAQDLQASITNDHDRIRVDPNDPSDLLTLARWGRSNGLFERDVRAALVADGGIKDPCLKISDEKVASWIHRNVSPYPERFSEVTAACQEVERRFLKAQVKRLEDCGKAWWRQLVVRIFWRNSRGQERLRRQIGIHRCKQSWCPTCGRSRQAHLTADIERILILAKDFGLDESHARLITLTVPNGRNIHDLRAQAHTAFAKLQRTRWWNHHAFGWVRGTEVVTGEDGNWNLHVHLLTIFWSPRVSYSELGRVWTQELGGPREGGRRFVVDCETLEAKRWVRRDGKDGALKQKGSLVRGARYITKYLTKVEELMKLKGGPGGLAHLLGATNGMRRFAVGSGCSVLRRVAKVLLPSRAFQTEEALADSYLYEGRVPWRVELLDPDTGEICDGDQVRLNDNHQEVLKAWGEALETNPLPRHGQALPGRVVGIPIGLKGRYRRLGPTPLAGRSPTVADFEKLGRGALTGFRALIADGDWKVFRWAERSSKTGKVHQFTAVLPRVRYSWRSVEAAISHAFGR